MIQPPKVNKGSTDLLSRAEQLPGQSKHVALGLAIFSMGLCVPALGSARRGWLAGGCLENAAVLP